MRVEKHQTFEPLTVQECKDARDKWIDRVGPDRFKLSCHPAGSLSVSGIESVLDGLLRDDFVPDVIICDYADIMAPLNSRMEKRDQSNQTWIALRALSQKRRSLVLTATQIKADGFDAWVLDRSHFAEDNRKYNQVTAMASINQTQQEKEVGIYRLAWLLGRRLTFKEGKCCWCAGALATGEPFILSSF